ncbi:hypothetical protein Hypma_014612, partial [Hypsizygus marmoreus]
QSSVRSFSCLGTTGTRQRHTTTTTTTSDHPTRYMGTSINFNHLFSANDIAASISDETSLEFAIIYPTIVVLLLICQHSFVDP